MPDFQQDHLSDKSKIDSSNEQARQRASSEEGSARDLGTAGGGAVPSSGDELNDVAPSRTTLPSSQDIQSEGDDQGLSHNANNVDPTAQSNLGGRTPAQSGNAMGDQDRTQSRPGDDPTDPMSSRTPEKVKQQKEQSDS